MNTRILLLALSAAVFSSCSTMYKSGQTPDDVYFSPGQERGGYVNTSNRNSGYGDYTDVSDRYLRMKSYNRSRWSGFDDDYMYWNDYRWNNPYMFNRWYSRPMIGWNSWGGLGYGYGLGYGMGMGYGHWGYNSMFYDPWMFNNPWGSFYYGQPVIILNPKPGYRNPVANGPRTYNLNTYTNSNRYYNESGRRFNNSYSGSNAPVRVFNNNPANTGAGRGGRYINTNSGSTPRGGYNPNTGSRNSGSPVRTFDRSNNNNTPSGGSRPSGGSSGGGSAPVRSFPRGG